MNVQATQSQMEQGELISYETNLVACYEAEYLLSLQYKTSCQCSDHHNVNNHPLNHTETMECHSWDSNDIEMEPRRSGDDDDITDDVINTRKRQHCDVGYSHTHNGKTNVTEQSEQREVNFSCWCDSDTNGEHDNSLVVTGQLLPHIKRMCFKAQ